MSANEQYKFVNAILLSNNIYKKYPHNNISLWCFVSLFNITLMSSNTKDREDLRDMFDLYYFIIFLHFYSLL